MLKADECWVAARRCGDGFVYARVEGFTYAWTSDVRRAAALTYRQGVDMARRGWGKPVRLIDVVYYWQDQKHHDVVNAQMEIEYHQQVRNAPDQMEITAPEERGAIMRQVERKRRQRSSAKYPRRWCRQQKERKIK